MSKTRIRGLSFLNRLYQFGSGARAAPSEVNVESPIQIVHDVSRALELSTIVTDPGASGFFEIGQDNVHAAGGETIVGTMSPYTDGSLDSSWGVPDGRWIWLMRYAGTVTSGAMVGAGASGVFVVQVPLLGNALAKRDFLIDAWGSADVIDIGTDIAAFAVGLGHFSGGTKNVANGVPLPFPIFPGGVLTWRSVATVAVPGTFRISCLCWIGPFGAYPPGLG